jgi:hypothetical protein
MDSHWILFEQFIHAWDVLLGFFTKRQLMMTLPIDRDHSTNYHLFGHSLSLTPLLACLFHRRLAVHGVNYDISIAVIVVRHGVLWIIHKLRRNVRPLQLVVDSSNSSPHSSRQNALELVPSSCCKVGATPLG